MDRTIDNYTIYLLVLWGLLLISRVADLLLNILNVYLACYAMLCYAIQCYIRCNIPCSIRTHRVPSHSPMAATATLLSSGFTTSRVCQLRAPASTKSTSQPWSSHPWSCWSWYRLSDGIKTVACGSRPRLM